MEITVHVRPEIESRLVAAAQARGLDVEAYAESVLEDAAQQERPLGQKQSLEEFQASLDALAQFSDKIPSLPIEAFSRESFYEGRD